MTQTERAQELRQRLREGLLISDGAMGTTLSAEGHTPGRSLELLNIEQPDLVRAAHRGFLGAGSNVLQTNTFQGSRPALERHGLAERTAELNAAAAALAREVAGDHAFVAGDIGPTGRILEPYGDFGESAARAAFEEQVQALADAQVDLLIVETFFSLEEAKLAIGAAVATGLPTVASMAFQYPPATTPWGVTPQYAAQELEATGVMVIGANCGTVSPDDMVKVIDLFHHATSLPLIAQPNAGRPELTESGVTYRESPESLADAAQRFLDLGATIIGGCCGTTPDHIRAIATRLRGR